MALTIDQLFPSKYFSAQDIPRGKRVTALIDHVVLEEVGQEQERKPVLYLRNKPKGVVLNRTNASMLASEFGRDVDKWTGREIEIRIERVAFRGEIKDGIRLYPVAEQPPAVEDPDDDIPW